MNQVGRADFFADVLVTALGVEHDGPVRYRPGRGLERRIRRHTILRRALRRRRDLDAAIDGYVDDDPTPVMITVPAITAVPPPRPKPTVPAWKRKFLERQTPVLLAENRHVQDQVLDSGFVPAADEPVHRGESL